MTSARPRGWCRATGRAPRPSLFLHRGRSRHEAPRNAVGVRASEVVPYGHVVGAQRGDGCGGGDLGVTRCGGRVGAQPARAAVGVEWCGCSGGCAEGAPRRAAVV
jgi:hypothetical protein